MFGKKKTQENKELSADEISSLVDKNKEKVEKEILIHTMPKKFLLGGDKATQAKKMGIIIFVAAGIFLVILIVLLYIFLFQTSPKNEVKNIEQDQEKLIKTDELKANKEKEEVTPKEEIINLIIDESTVVSTSSEEVIDTEVSTSTIDEEISTSTIDIEEDVIDSDGDGLNNIEENLLSTNIEEIDSDGDGYSDFEEIMSLYDPISSGKLVDNLGIDEYINTSYNYSILYPSDWKMNILGSDDSIVFKSKDNHIFQIYVQPNSNIKTIERWYEEQVGSKPSIQNIITTEEWKGILSNNGLVIYLTDVNYNFIYTLLYIPEFDEEKSYENIFQMMINSLKIKDL